MRHESVSGHITDDGFELRGLWGIPELYLAISEFTPPLVEALTHIRMDARFDAIVHCDRNEIEFVFTFLNPNDEADKEYLNRVFSFAFDDKLFACRYAPPSDRLLELARAFRRIPSEDSAKHVPQLNAFRDWHRREELPENIQAFFRDKTPRSFYVSGPIDSLDLSILCRHLNRVAKYYDRKSPIITIRDDDTPAILGTRKGVRFITNSFPDALACRPIDDVILTLLENGAESRHVRMAYLYYYQVFEYAAYCYTDHNVKMRLRQILRDPSVINCYDDTIIELYDTLISNNHSDDVKIQRVIEDHVDFRRVWVDVWNDSEFFAARQEFDGGFVAEPLISKDTTAESWTTLAVPKVYKILTQIRNVIVHAREKRENKVILPTASNGRRLAHYVPLIRRIAEELAFRA